MGSPKAKGLMEWGSQAKMRTKKTLLEFWNATRAHVIVHNHSSLVENWFSVFVVCFLKDTRSLTLWNLHQWLCCLKPCNANPAFKSIYIKFGLWPNSRIKHFISVMPLRLAPWALPCTFTLLVNPVSFTTLVKCFFSYFHAGRDIAVVRAALI
jgi:hypothetical protein